jgi:hypothetical protein
MDYSDKSRRTMSEALQARRLKEDELAFVQGSPRRPTAMTGTATNPVPGSVSMTFRLPADLAARLIRTATERKLNRQEPFTQQEIVTEAVSAWLSKQEHSD